MDWQLIEISVVTVLALWVALFAGNTFSRLAATVMIVLNVVWILFERERTSKAGLHWSRRSAPRGPASRAEPIDGAAAGQRAGPDQAATPGERTGPGQTEPAPAPRDPHRPRIL